MIRVPGKDARSQLVLHAVLLCLASVWAYPVVWTLSNSLKSTGDLYAAPWSLPNPPRFENIAAAWTQGQLGQALLNSAYVSVASVSLILVFAVPAAFAFARLALPLPAALGLAILVPMMIPSEIVMLPVFVMFRALGLVNSREGVIALEVASGVAFAAVVLTTFFRSVPRDLEDAARMDGAHSLQVRRYLILPLAGPGIAAVTVFESVFVWNDYFGPLILIQKPELFTVQLAIGNFSNFYATDQVVLFAGLAIAIVPPLVVFALLQRSFVSGLTGGAWRARTSALLATKLFVPHPRRGVEEVLKRESEAVRRFLLQTSILDRFSASLCAAGSRAAWLAQGASGEIAARSAGARRPSTPARCCLRACSTRSSGTSAHGGAGLTGARRGGRTRLPKSLRHARRPSRRPRSRAG